MKETKFRKTKTEKGITLVALIITIVVLLILAVVAINAITNDGILGHAQNSAETYNQAVRNEQTMLNKYEEYLNNLQTEKEEPKDYIGTDSESSYIGYYVDMDGNPATAPEGVIYADLAKGVNASWGRVSATYDAVTSDLKNYYVLAESYEGAFGTKPVLTTDGTGGATQRFYVMALTDFTTTEYNNSNFYWYYNADINETGSGNADETVTSTAFGDGDYNTEVMMNDYYGNEDWGAATDGDIWKYIGTEVNNGWFIPSMEEWSVFAGAFGLTSDSSSEKYYGAYGLSSEYWSSSIACSYNAWEARFWEDVMYGVGVNPTCMGGAMRIRLSSTY